METTKKYKFSIASSTDREKAIMLHRKRYSEVGFMLENEEDPYETDSVYFVAQNPNQEQSIVGVTRLIFKPLMELPTLEHFSIYDLELQKLRKLDHNCYAEVSAFTKMPQHEVGMDIIRTVFQYSLQQGITHWICCIDQRVFNYLNRIFGPVFKLIGEPKVYLGSVTIPCVLDIPAGTPILKNTKPKLYEFLFNYENQFMEATK